METKTISIVFLTSARTVQARWTVPRQRRLGKGRGYFGRQAQQKLRDGTVQIPKTQTNGGLSQSPDWGMPQRSHRGAVGRGATHKSSLQRVPCQPSRPSQTPHLRAEAELPCPSHASYVLSGLASPLIGPSPRRVPRHPSGRPPCPSTARKEMLLQLPGTALGQLLRKQVRPIVGTSDSLVVLGSRSGSVR